MPKRKQEQFDSELEDITATIPELLGFAMGEIIAQGKRKKLSPTELVAEGMERVASNLRENNA